MRVFFVLQNVVSSDFLIHDRHGSLWQVEEEQEQEEGQVISRLGTHSPCVLFNTLGHTRCCLGGGG